MSFWAVWCSIFGRTREARDEVCEDAEAVCSASMVVLWAMQALAEVSIIQRKVQKTY